MRMVCKQMLDIYLLFVELPAGLKDWNVDREKKSPGQADAPA